MFQQEQHGPSPSSWRPRPFHLTLVSLVLLPIGLSGACGGSSSGSGHISGAGGAAGGGGIAGHPSSSGGAGGGAAGGGGVAGHPSSSGGAGGAAMAGGAGGAPSAGGAGGLSVIGGSGGAGGKGGMAPTPIFQGTGGNGTLSWTGNGSSYTSTGYYEESPSADGMSFDIVIASDVQSSGAACALTGRFPAVPPPAGSYPMTDFDSPQVDGTFVARCETGAVAHGAEDRSMSGQVVISLSVPGSVEGAFVMHAARSIAGTGGTVGSVVYSGAFSVGCRDTRPTTDPSCGAQPASP